MAPNFRSRAIRPGGEKITQGKRSKSELLPSRDAMSKLVGDPGQRALGNYAKATPGPANTYQSILDMGIQPKPKFR